jgi:transcriptional regulator of acetoin/glycerol metabolism
MLNNVHPIRPPTPQEPCIRIFTAGGEVRKLDEIERDVICLALLLNKGCVTKAAVQLGIGRSTLYRKLPELDPSRASSL